MEKNLSEKALWPITTLLIIITFLLSLNFRIKNSLHLFLLVFGLVYWQRKRLQGFSRRIRSLKVYDALYILSGWLWAIFLEYNLGRLVFSPKPITNLLVGLGFYLPYFAIYLSFIKRYKFNFFEIFYLGGFGKALFDLLITRKLTSSAVFVFSPRLALIAILARTIVIVTLFGALTSLPLLLLSGPEGESRKSFKRYLLGITPNFLAAGVFIVWTIILKIVFR